MKITAASRVVVIRRAQMHRCKNFQHRCRREAANRGVFKPTTFLRMVRSFWCRNFNPFLTNAPFLYLLKTSEIRKVF